MNLESLALCRILLTYRKAFAVCYAQGTRPRTRESCGLKHTAPIEGNAPKTFGTRDKEKDKEKWKTKENREVA